MANYYHEARAHARALKNMQEDNKRRAERKTELANVQAEQPLNMLRVDGRQMKISKNDFQYQAVERKEGMFPWNGEENNLIDRFDGRALLDFYVEPRTSSSSRKSAEQLELDEVLAFESYRDLVHLSKLGLSEEKGILQAELDNIEFRATARTAAAASAARPEEANTSVPGFSSYSAVGYSYDGRQDSDASSDSEASNSDNSQSGDEAGQLEEDAAAEAAAATLGIQNFNTLLHRAVQQEIEEADALRKKPRQRVSRKKAVERARRMAGQGLGPLVQDREKLREMPDRPRAVAAHQITSRYSPERDIRRRRVSRSSSRSQSPAARRGRDRPRVEYISEFSSRPERGDRPGARGLHHGSRPAPTLASSHSAKRDDQQILEALPNRADPAVVGGPVALPSQAATMQGIRPGRYQNHERGREAPVRPLLVPQPAKVEKAKETPKERLKRLMEAQLNRTILQDAVHANKKKAAEERDKQARLQIEAALKPRSPSPRPRSRSRSPSPARYRDRSRSRSPRRYRSYRSRSRERR